jgi:kynurenine formamidase
MKKIGAFFVLALFCASCVQQKSASDLQTGEWIDLSHDFSDQTVYWVNADPFKREGTQGMTPQGFYYAQGNYSAAEHGGTHIDAPFHFAEGKKTVDQLTLTDLIGPAVKIDVSDKAGANRDYLVTVADIESWEKANGRIADGTIVLLQTGFAKYWPDKKQYLGTAEHGDVAAKDLHFPGLDPEAAKWLIQQRKVKAVGLDTASIDFGQSSEFKTHVELMTHNVPAFENLADLEGLPAKGFQIIALPMKIKGGSGAPLRIVAFLPNAAVR